MSCCSIKNQFYRQKLYKLEHNYKLKLKLSHE